MTAKAEAQSPAIDNVKLALAVGLVAAAIGAFYYFADQSLLLRVVGLLAVTGVAVLIASGTALGRRAFAFTKESRAELRKVIWPSRQETLQTTLAVFVMVIVVAILLWMIDMFLAWLVRMFVA
jgi:preprotein translocase subunit SecE